MANRQYISIIRLFRHLGIDSESKFDVSRARKLLHAEFAVSQQGFLEADGFSYSREDVFEELDQPDFAERLEFHKIIWEAPALLSLLERNETNVYELGEAFARFQNNEPFDEFFSPYFSESFRYLSGSLLAKGQYEDLGELLRYEDFLLPQDRERAFQPIRLWLDESLRYLRNVTGENYSIMRKGMGKWGREWSKLFNNFPEEFAEEKAQIVGLLINLTVHIQKKYRRDCVLISEQLHLLSGLSSERRRLIVSNHAAYTQSRFRLNNWGLWIVISIVVRMLIFNNGCKDDSSSQYRNLQYAPVTFVDSFNRHLDSNAKINPDSLHIRIVQ